MKKKMSLGELLKAARIEKGLSRDKVGEAAGISASTMGQIERGSIKKPPMIRLTSFSLTLGIPMSAIMEAMEVMR